jgi:hypothetical protein
MKKDSLMKLSKQTLEILRNFSTVNQNILISEGSVLTTRTVAKNIFVEATVPDTFTQEMGLYNLPEFLGITSLFSDPEFELSEHSVTIRQDKNKVQYVFASKEVLDYPDKPIKMPATDATFELSEENLKSLLKAGSVLSATDLLIQGQDGLINCTVLDPKNPSSNTFSVEVGTTDRAFSAYIKLENLKMISGMYEVNLSSKKIAQFKSKTLDYNFYIANEKTSTWS